MLNVQCIYSYSTVICICTAAVASSQCYWDERMLLKCQINTNRNKKGFLLPILSFIYLKILQMFLYFLSYV